MKLIPALLIVGMLAVSGWAEDTKPEPYSPELVKKAEAGDAKAQYDLAVCYCEGEGVEKDYKEGVKWFTKSAEQVYAAGQANLGWCYANGEGVPQDYKEAVKWHMKSAEQGVSAAQYALGDYYAKGQGVPQDYKEAVKWYTKSANQDNPRGQMRLGDSYYYGQGVPQDYKEAVKWFKKSAEGGDSDGQERLGTCFNMGLGVDINPVEAVRWYKKSAEQGNTEGQSCLGTSYNNGTGVKENLEEAFKWTLKAAEQGSERDQWMTGIYYITGRGVAKNKTEAVRWFTKSAEQGNKYAEEQLIKIQSNVDLPKAPIIMRVQTPSAAIAWLTDPGKLATLTDERAANSRLQKCVYWLAYAEEQGEKPEAVLDQSAKLNKTVGSPYAGFLSWGLLENLKIARELGLLTPEGMAELKQGKPATITKGQYAGQKAEADDVIPRAVCPELQNQVMNLELLPASLKQAKSEKVTDRAKVFAKELYEAKLLSEEGWQKVKGCPP